MPPRYNPPATGSASVPAPGPYALIRTMHRWLKYLGGTLAALMFVYGALAALVNQGLSLVGALVMLILILGGGLALLLVLRN